MVHHLRHLLISTKHKAKADGNAIWSQYWTNGNFDLIVVWKSDLHPDQKISCNKMDSTKAREN